MSIKEFMDQMDVAISNNEEILKFGENLKQSVKDGVVWNDGVTCCKKCGRKLDKELRDASREKRSVLRCEGCGRDIKISMRTPFVRISDGKYTAFVKVHIWYKDIFKDTVNVWYYFEEGIVFGKSGQTLYTIKNRNRFSFNNHPDVTEDVLKLLPEINSEYHDEIVSVVFKLQKRYRKKRHEMLEQYDEETLRDIEAIEKDVRTIPFYEWEERRIVFSRNPGECFSTFFVESPLSVHYNSGKELIEEHELFKSVFPDAELPVTGSFNAGGCHDKIPEYITRIHTVNSEKIIVYRVTVKLSGDHLEVAYDSGHRCNMEYIRISTSSATAVYRRICQGNTAEERNQHRYKQRDFLKTASLLEENGIDSHFLKAMGEKGHYLTHPVITPSVFPLAKLLITGMQMPFLESVLKNEDYGEVIFKTLYEDIKFSPKYPDDGDNLIVISSFINDSTVFPVKSIHSYMGFRDQVIYDAIAKNNIRDKEILLMVSDYYRKFRNPKDCVSIIEIAGKLSFYRYGELLGKLYSETKPSRILKYLQDVEEYQCIESISDIMVLWSDYISMNEQLGVVLKGKKLFTENLKRDHDITVKSFNLLKDEINDKRVSERYEKMKDFAYSKNGYVIRPAVSAKELIDEGVSLNHCVGSYVEKVASGKTNIFLIRKETEPEVSYYTLELSEPRPDDNKERRIIQIRGLSQLRVPEDEKDPLRNMITSWCDIHHFTTCE